MEYAESLPAYSFFIRPSFETLVEIDPPSIAHDLKVILPVF
ncbi:hypothetical protein LEP1GSC052_2491 [Leptospira kmetyi serovar Malaysia str. Bejo-Iso9]|nr:hypothetical protein LEP1GSC052_2491 [Leptospira kmetyi serovar Malaysia str. Bejo-Iso9]